MARQLEAVFEKGVLRPLEPLHLSEHQHVRLTIEEKCGSSNQKSHEAVNERNAEFTWLANESNSYAGQWVALDGNRLVAHGRTLAAVSASALAAGVSEPFFASVPDDNLPFGGW